MNDELCENCIRKSGPIDEDPKIDADPFNRKYLLERIGMGLDYILIRGQVGCTMQCNILP